MQGTHILLLLLLARVLTISVAQRFPENTCAQYFQYIQIGIGSFQGELTLGLQNGRNRIDVRFSQRGAQDQAVVGAMQPHPDEATVRANRAAAKFRLNLWPDASGVLPKLTRLAFNDVTLCTASEYNPPKSFFNRFYVLQVSGLQTPRRLAPSPVVHTFSGGQSDVEIKTLIIDAGQGSISDILSDWVNEQTPTSAASWSPWPPATASTTTSDASWQSWPPPTTPMVSITPSAPWLPAAPTPSFVPTIPRLNPKSDLPPILRLPTLVCGQEGTSVPFIQRGEDFPRGRYPWLTALFHKESLSLSFKCGGSLISTSLVITAAHCVYRIKEDRVLVALGRYDLDNYREDGAEVRDAMRIVLHPEYSSRLQLMPDADIALITLDHPVTFNDVISPICLWEAAETKVEVEIGSIAGWGTDEMGNSVTRYPRVVEAKIATEAECVRKWQVQKVLERTLCAGNLDGSGPCLGDSGGGLMVKRNNRWLLRGIVSQGERSSVDHCNNSQYVLYCDLSKHMTWISQNIS